MAVVLSLVLLWNLPACGVFSYEIARAEYDDPVDPHWLDDLLVGQTRFREAVNRLGPPDRIAFLWNSMGRRTTRLEFAQVRERSSDVTVHIPRQEVGTYNSGVRFFLLFLRAMRGKSVVPPELEVLRPTDPSQDRVTSATNRLSEWRSAGATDGRAPRLSDLRGSVVADPADDENPMRPLAAINLEGSARGRNVLRLEFDEAGILALKQLGQSAPQTDVLGQMRESILR